MKSDNQVHLSIDADFRVERIRLDEDQKIEAEVWLNGRQMGVVTIPHRQDLVIWNEDADGQPDVVWHLTADQIAESWQADGRVYVEVDVHGETFPTVDSYSAVVIRPTL